MIRSINNRLRILAFGFAIALYQDVEHEKKIGYMLVFEKLFGLSLGVIFGLPLVFLVYDLTSGQSFFTSSYQGHILILFGTLFTLTKNTLPSHWRDGVIDSKFTATVHTGIWMLLIGSLFTIQGFAGEIESSYLLSKILSELSPFLITALFVWSFYKWSEEIVVTDGDSIDTQSWPSTPEGEEKGY
jgi:hypothetical protein